MSRSLPTTLRARAYIRVSHIGKTRKDTLLSDAMQLEEARRYCAFAGLDLDEEGSKACADLDVSAFRKPWRERPGLLALYDAARRREIDCIVFFKLSRLSRNVREALDLIDAFEKEGVAFHFVAERLDTTSAQGRFLRNVLLAAAEMQSEDASSFLKAACEQRARSGKVQGGGTPIWIRRSESGFETIPEQVAAIRRLLALRLEGLGYVKIAKQLNLEGHRTPRGKYWTHGATFKYLQDSFVQTMLGTAFYGRSSPSPIEIPNAYPAIITREEADRIRAIQRLYSAEYGRKPVNGLDWMVSKRRKEGRRSASSIHLLSGIAFCPACGSRVVATLKGQGGNRTSPHAYHCPHSTSRSELHVVKGLNSVNALALEDAVLRVLRSVLVMPPAAFPVRQKEELDQFPAIQLKIDRLLALHLDGRVEDDDFKRAYAALLAEKETVVAQRRFDPIPAQHRQAMALASRSELSREELRQLVLLMVERVEAPLVVEGVTIRVDRPTLRRLARISLRFPTADGHGEFLAPIYNMEYSGARRSIALTRDGQADLRVLIAPKSSS